MGYRVFTKTPYEKFPININFGTNLASGETLSSIVSATALNLATAASSTSTIIQSSAISGQKVVLVVKAGTDGERHKLTVKATTSLGNEFESEMFLNVKYSQEVFSKQPVESFTVSADFAKVLPSAEYITSAVISATNAATGASASVIGSQSIGTPATGVSFVATGGSNENLYRISVQVATTSAYQYEMVFYMKVNDV